MTAERWVSVDAVAKHLGVAKDSVYRWIDSRRLPHSQNRPSLEVQTDRGRQVG